jgi:transcriptional regulator NrdR family protein
MYTCFNSFADDMLEWIQVDGEYIKKDDHSHEVKVETDKMFRKVCRAAKMYGYSIDKIQKIVQHIQRQTKSCSSM